ncbi:Pfs, NACHT and Ankyrin domain-containing protein [Cordyceps javanica]|uniref:Pfs, NACHT and Ankyrin domain-containing protein n=1 Tax=Cordyceps javanica TaxID=43265 RepID=A0A545UQ16_9HYPO|nr:Pfs, NACHT and Ankyrin domain-containing protein [Cordyceps javanica]TQW03672.1 Pfs, NACHT and Ankyrin domain protein [Cordyceps javanica]
MPFWGASASRDSAGDRGMMARAPNRRTSQGSTRANASSPTFSHGDYTVGWICALSKEMAAAEAMLDVLHNELPRAQNDTNAYTLGSIAANNVAHNVAITCLPSGYYGNNNAATVASNLRRTFPSARLCLMVGIGGGVPGQADIRLGDVVVSEGVLQYDLGKLAKDGHFMRTGSLRSPPHELLTAITKLRAKHDLGPSQIPSILSDMLERHPNMTQYIHRPSLRDWLFNSKYNHVELSGYPTDDCELCDESRLEIRPPRSDLNPKIHYGTIASGNQVMKHGKTRTELAHELHALCFEMEGAGVMDGFSGLVIRGICDYSDSHKNKQWQEVAAAVAAAYAKELLLTLPSDPCTTMPRVVTPSDTIGEYIHSLHLRISLSPPQRPDRQTDLLYSLSFEQIYARRSNIKPKYSTTCQWLLTHSAYLNWLDSNQTGKHGGFLWIQGGPGTGKSTIMSFAYGEARKNKEVIPVSFFFNARGEILERSTPGMYRSLLFQILLALPNLCAVFDEPEQKDSLDEIHKAILSRKSPVWMPLVLQNLLRSALAKLGQTRLIIFVDALDECAPDEMEELVDYFEDLGQDAMESESRLGICFSSRYYPQFDIQHSLKITLECQDGHEKDIAMYIRNKLKIHNTQTAEEVTTQIRTKAKGIFIWVVLVVKILNGLYHRGRIFEVKQQLAALPDQLGDLFREILSRDKLNSGDLKLCIQWILFAKRPLRLEEYYFAAVAARSPGRLQEWHPEEVSPDDMSRFVISSSKGLAEVTRSKFRTVQFIHESVRDYFFKDGLRELWPDLPAEDFESVSHNQLCEYCYSYFKLSTFNEVVQSRCHSVPNASSDAAKQMHDHVSRKFPFLEYATRFVLYHANAAAKKNSKETFLLEFPVKAWVLLDNLFETLEIRRHTVNASLVYILAENNLAQLINCILRFDSRIEIKGERYQYPLFAALANGHRDAVEALLQTQTGHPPENILGLTDHWRIFGLWEARNKTPLTWAAYKGDVDLVRRLLERGSDIGAEGGPLGTPLSHAVTMGHIATVKLLLEKGANVMTKDCYARTPLANSIKNGNGAIARLLLDRGACVETKDNQHQTPLQLAVSYGNRDIVKLLLDRGARSEYEPLQLAALGGHHHILDLLLEKWAGSETRLLLQAAQQGNEVMVKLLLEKGTDVKAEIDSWTALLPAAGDGL